MLAEEEASTKRLEKVERLKKAWQKRRDLKAFLKKS